MKFSLAACDRIVALARPRTRDVVQLARVVWESAVRMGEADEAVVDAGLERLVREAGALFSAQWRSRQTADQRILRALAAEPDLALLGVEALDRYRLGPKSTVSSALARLVEQEVLARDDAGRYAFDDPFFRRGVQVNALGDLGLPIPPLLPATVPPRVR